MNFSRVVRYFTLSCQQPSFCDGPQKTNRRNVGNRTAKFRWLDFAFASLKASVMEMSFRCTRQPFCKLEVQTGMHAKSSGRCDLLPAPKSVEDGLAAWEHLGTKWKGGRD